MTAQVSREIPNCAAWATFQPLRLGLGVENDRFDLVWSGVCTALEAPCGNRRGRGSKAPIAAESRVQGRAAVTITRAVGQAGSLARHCGSSAHIYARGDIA